MKRLFTLAVAVFATIVVASAQDYDMYVIGTDGSETKFKVEDIAEITWPERPDPTEGWVSLGYCLYGEDLLGSTLYPSNGSPGAYCCDYYVEVQEREDQPGLYRLVNPYGPDVYPWASSTTYDTSQDWYIEINACDPEGVYIEYQDTGMNWGSFGRFYVWSFASRFYDEGYSWDEIKYYGWAGTLEDGVITFPASSLMTQFPEYSSGYFYGNYFGKFKLDLNDKRETGGAKDTKTLSATEDEQLYDMHVTRTNGAVAKFKLEEVEKVTITARPDPNEGWTSLGYCLYGEDFLGSTLYPANGKTGDFCCDYYVEVQECDTLPGLYRLVNPYGPAVYPWSEYTSYDTSENYYIEINCTDPEGVYIEYQDTGLSWSPYGRFYVYSVAMEYRDIGYSWKSIKNAGYCGTMVDGVITFPSQMLYTLFPSYSSRQYPANLNNRFKLDLNDKRDVGGVKEAKQLAPREDIINMDTLLPAEELKKMKINK